MTKAATTSYRGLPSRSATLLQWTGIFSKNHSYRMLFQAIERVQESHELAVEQLRTDRNDFITATSYPRQRLDVLCRCDCDRRASGEDPEEESIVAGRSSE